MPLPQVSYQLRLPLDLPEEESVSVLSTEDIRIRSEVARKKMESGSLWEVGTDGERKLPSWYEQYLGLVHGGWEWRVAVLIVWLATPKNYRIPKTQSALAEMLGLSSDRQFTVWIAKNPAILAKVQEMRYAMVWEDLGEVLAAGLHVAKTHDYKGKGDREMIYKMAGILSDKVEAEIINKNGHVDLVKLPWDQKLKLAGFDNPQALLELKEKLIQYRAEDNDFVPDSSGESESEKEDGDVTS